MSGHLALLRFLVIQFLFLIAGYYICLIKNCSFFVILCELFQEGMLGWLWTAAILFQEVHEIRFHLHTDPFTEVIILCVDVHVPEVH